MKYLFRLVAFVCLLPALSFGQGMLASWIPEQFTDNLGVPVASGFVCTFAAGTTTPQVTYQEATLSVQNQNPIRLDSAGRPVNGSTPVSIFVGHQGYKYVLYASGTGNSCNGTTVGAPILTRDGVINYPDILPLGALELDNNASPPTTTTGKTYLYNDAGGSAKICQNGSPCVNLVGSGVSGLTSGTIPVATSATTLGDSFLLEDPHTNPQHVLKINELTLVNGTASDITSAGGASLVAIGNIISVSASANAQTVGLVPATAGYGFVSFSHSGGATTSDGVIGFDSNGTPANTEALRLKYNAGVGTFLQLTSSYTGANLSAAGTVAIRNNAGVLESSQNGGAWTALAAGGTVTNSGTSAAVFPVLSTATNITNSFMAQAAGPFLVLATSYTGGSLSTAGTVALRNNAGALEKSENGGAWTAVAGGGTVSGTTGTFAKFSGATAVGNSSYMTENTGTAFVLINGASMRVGSLTDDFGIGSVRTVGVGYMTANAATNAFVGTFGTFGGGTPAARLSATHSGSATSPRLELAVDGGVGLVVRPGSASVCVFTGGALHLLLISGSNFVDGGTC